MYYIFFQKAFNNQKKRLIKTLYPILIEIISVKHLESSTRHWYLRVKH